MVARTVTAGRLGGGSGDDVLTGIAQSGTGQIHAYAAAGDDIVNLGFSPDISGFSHGHHVRGDADGNKPTGNDRGNDSFNFVDTNNVAYGTLVVGRLEDFDSRDVLYIDGNRIDLNALPANVRIVEFNGAHNDLDGTSQQWLLITTATGGHIFYALEGNRIDMIPDASGTPNGGANQGVEEAHFLQETDLEQFKVSDGSWDFGSLVDVDYVDPENSVPAGFATEQAAALAQGGTVINDYDNSVQDVLDHLTGTSKNDLIAAGLNSDTVYAGDGNDIIWGGSGHDEISSGSGHDAIYGGNDNDLIHAGIGNDTIEGSQGNDIIFGGNGRDVIFGGDGNDVIDGGKWEDTLYGGEGDDILEGGSSADRLYGENGHDELFGGYSADYLSGGDGQDELYGGSNNDVLEGGRGEDQMYGGSGHDTMYGDQDNDIIFGGNGRDVIFGGDGNDIIDGGKWEDTLYGGKGDDILQGGNAADRLYGGEGNDTLDGGITDDVLSGGSGSDVFIFADGYRSDTILDFSTNEVDKIDLSGVSGIESFTDLVNNHLVEDGDSNAVIVANSVTITLVDIGVEQFGISVSESDFIF